MLVRTGASERPEAPSAQALAKEAIDAEQARLERARVATTATRVIGTYRFARGPRELVITDVGLTVTYYDYGSPGKPLVRNAGYWEVKEIELEKDQEDRTRSLGLVIRLEGRGSMPPMVTGGRLQGDSTPEAVFGQLNAAMQAWRQKYPDRTTWIPAN